ncbi:hypothetical protein EVA_06272 [gut metagenome]|uniref:Uncharacterized protein n=1 Tax=gut metagenome TaxID=749906 RepID=J9CZB9_9ZZZZ
MEMLFVMYNGEVCGTAWQNLWHRLAEYNCPIDYRRD